METIILYRYRCTRDIGTPPQNGGPIPISLPHISKDMGTGVPEIFSDMGTEGLQNSGDMGIL